MENDINKTIEKLLGDPDMMNKIKSIASSLNLQQTAPFASQGGGMSGGGLFQGGASQPAPQGGTSQGCSPQSGAFQGTGGFAPSVQPARDDTSEKNINLKNCGTLISALCPFLEGEKRKRAERLLELISIAQTAGTLSKLI